MKPVLIHTIAKVAALLALAIAIASCSILDKPAPPVCQGDPVLKPCSCMDPRTPTCPKPPSDAKKPKRKAPTQVDGGSAPDHR